MRKLPLVLFFVCSCLFGQSADLFERLDLFGRLGILGEKTSSGITVVKTWDEALRGSYGDQFVLFGFCTTGKNEPGVDVSEKDLFIYDGTAFEGPVRNELNRFARRRFVEDEQVAGMWFTGEFAFYIVVVEVYQRDYIVQGVVVPMGKRLRVISYISIDDFLEYFSLIDVTEMKTQAMVNYWFNPDGWAEFLKSKQ